MGTITKTINGQRYTFEVTREYEIAQKLVELSNKSVTFSFKRVSTFQVDIFVQFFDAYNKNNPYAKPYACNKVNKKVCSLFFNWSGNIVTYRAEMPDEDHLFVCPQLIQLLENWDVVVIKAIRTKKFYTLYKINVKYLKWLLRDCDKNASAGVKPVQTCGSKAGRAEHYDGDVSNSAVVANNRSELVRSQTALFVPVDKKYFNYIAYQAPDKLKKLKEK